MSHFLSDTRVSQLRDLGLLRRDGDTIPSGVGVQELLDVLPPRLATASGVVYRLGMDHTDLGWSAGYYVYVDGGRASVLSVDNAPELVDALYLLVLQWWQQEHLHVD